MNVLKNYTFSSVLDAFMNNRTQARFRQDVIAPANGNILEIGIGSGLNLKHYSRRVETIVGIDPSPGALRICAKRARKSGLRVTLVRGRAERLPFADHVFDTVVTTWTLCSVDDVAFALLEVRRTLKPSGKLLFLEHGRSADHLVVGLQDFLTPVTKLSSGCRINRPIAKLLREAGFKINCLRTRYAGRMKPFVYMYEGCATPQEAPAAVTVTNK